MYCLIEKNTKPQYIFNKLEDTRLKVRSNEKK